MRIRKLVVKGGPDRGPLQVRTTREFKDVVFEDVVFDNNRFYIIPYLYFT